jgi:ketosteroid isomerase-like protein
VPIVAEADLRAMLERHVGKYNEAVRTSDFGPFLDMYADNAVLSFDDVPVGPFYGRAAIEEAYADQPPNDTMWLIDMHEVGDDAVTASFEWEAGGTGELFLRWESGLITEQRIVALNVVDLGEKGLP